jgi:hypothetical protein
LGKSTDLRFEAISFGSLTKAIPRQQQTQRPLLDWPQSKKLKG